MDIHKVTIYVFSKISVTYFYRITMGDIPFIGSPIMQTLGALSYSLIR